MLTEKLKGVSSNSQVKLTGADSKKLEGSRAQSKDAVSVSKKTQVGKTEDLKETAKMLNFKKSLEKLVDKLGSTYDYEVDLGVTKLCNLKTASNSEIKKKLMEDTYFDRASDVAEGKAAISNFKRDAHRILATGGNLERGSEVLNKIIGLFQNSNFSKIAYVNLASEDGFNSMSYLVGINKNNQMIGIYNGLTE